MRITMIALLISAPALPVMGAAGPVVWPAQITIRVGESVTLHGYQNAGGLSEGFPYHHEFYSDAPGVATVRGFASGSATTRPDPLPGNGDVFVIAIAPGLAHVRAKACCADLAEITVRSQIRPVKIHAETSRVLLGQPVVLLAVARYDQPPTFFWYRGQMGDGTRLIQASANPQLTFVAEDSGKSHIWVQAFAGPESSSAEIVIEAAVPRRRTAKP